MDHVGGRQHCECCQTHCILSGLDNYCAIYLLDSEPNSQKSDEKNNNIQTLPVTQRTMSQPNVLIRIYYKTLCDVSWHRGPIAAVNTVYDQ